MSDPNNRRVDAIIAWTCAALLYGLVMYDLGRSDMLDDIADQIELVEARAQQLEATIATLARRSM